jgi:hypothetical protein
MAIIARNLKKDGIEISFDSRQPEEVKMWLSNNHFRWSKFSNLYWKKYDDKTWTAVHEYFNVPLPAVDTTELPIGIAIEKEHTSDPVVAEKIALDHLKENPNYYSEPKPANWAEKELKKEAAMTNIPKGIKKDVLFLLGLHKSKLEGKGTGGYDINLFKSSLYGKLKTMHKNGKQAEVDAILEFLGKTNQELGLPPVFTPAHGIIKLKSKPTEEDKKKVEALLKVEPVKEAPWITIIPNTNSAYDIQGQKFIKAFISKINVKKLVAIADKDLNYEAYGVFTKIYPEDSEVLLVTSIEKAYQAALNYDLEDLNIVKAKKVGNNIQYDYFIGSLFGDYRGEKYDEKGNLKQSVKDAAILLIKERFEHIAESISLSKRDLEDKTIEELDELIKQLEQGATDLIQTGGRTEDLVKLRGLIGIIVDLRSRDNVEYNKIVGNQFAPSGRAVNPGLNRPSFMKENILKGREIQLSMPNGEKRNAIFAIVELDNIIASHNEDNFHSEPLYPKNASGNNINDRNYSGDLSAQKAVMDYARELEPERLITTSRTPSGTPIITKDGFVVSGNNRTMSLKLAAKNYPENFQEYVKYLAEEIESIGFSKFVGKSLLTNDDIPIEGSSYLNPKRVSFTHPVLVRIDLDFPEYTTQELAKYNKDTKKSERPIDKAIKLSNILRDNSRCAEIIAEIVGDYETFSEFYANIQGQKRLAKTLVECSLLTDQELPAYFSDTTFTETGKEFIENLLAALILDREALMATEQPGVKAIRQKLITALPVLMKNASLPEGSLKKNFNDAVILQYNMKGSTFADFIRQRTMFGDKYDRETVYINRLIDSGKIKFKQAIEGYNNAIMQNQGASLFGEKPSNDDIFNHWIVGGVSETDKKLIESSDMVFDPTFNKKYLDEKIESATPNLSKIEDVDESLAEIRGEEPELRKEFLREQEGLKLYLVDGEQVRKDKIMFVSGGHGYVYDWIPKDEVWIDDNQKDKPSDMEATIKHELFEIKKMRDEGLSYDDAHELANAMEKEVRNEPEITGLSEIDKLNSIDTESYDYWFERYSAWGKGEVEEVYDKYYKEHASDPDFLNSANNRFKALIAVAKKKGIISLIKGEKEKVKPGVKQSRSDFIEQLHVLDMWRYFPEDGREYRKFLLSEKASRDVTDLGIKESMRDVKISGIDYLEAVISIPMGSENLKDEIEVAYQENTGIETIIKPSKPEVKDVFPEIAEKKEPWEEIAEWVAEGGDIDIKEYTEEDLRLYAKKTGFGNYKIEIAVQTGKTTHNEAVDRSRLIDNFRDIVFLKQIFECQDEKIRRIGQITHDIYTILKYDQPIEFNCKGISGNIQQMNFTKDKTGVEKMPDEIRAERDESLSQDYIDKRLAEIRAGVADDEKEYVDDIRWEKEGNETNLNIWYEKDTRLTILSVEELKLKHLQEVSLWSNWIKADYFRRKPYFVGNNVNKDAIKNEVIRLLNTREIGLILNQSQGVLSTAFFKYYSMDRYGKQATPSSLNFSDYKSEFELNKEIEKILDAKWNGKREDFTEHELDFISHYSGYGGLDDEAFKAGQKLDTKSFYEFYTPDLVIEKMWGLAYKYGYSEGRVCEPSASIGLFLSRKYVKSSVIKDAYEINKYSAKICKLLYPEVNVNDGAETKFFEQLFIKNNYTIRGNISPVHDLVIGNPPYGKFEGLYAGMGEKTYSHAMNHIDYFIFRGLDLLKPGGLLIYIIGAEVAAGGKPWLDQGDSKCKQLIAAKAKLLDAYRLPEGLFARTNVVSDIVVFKKKG